MVDDFSMQQYYSYFLAFLMTALCVSLLRRRAVNIGLVDHPAPRKPHGMAIPLVGGIAIFCGFMFALLTLNIPLSGMRSFFAASLVLIVIGVLDDFHELSFISRFAVQIVAGLLMTLWGGVVLNDLGMLFPGGKLLTLGLLAVPFTVFGTVGIINAINFSDGIDGLSGSLSIVALLALAWMSYLAGQGAQMQILLLLACCVSAFLAFNFSLPWRPQAMVFLGDAGSMFLGFALTWFVVTLSQGEQRVIAPVTALWFLALPLFDTVGVMLRRLLKRRSPFRADREHFHHIFLLAGFSVFETVLIMMFLALTGVLVGMAGEFFQIPETLMFGGFLAMFALYFLGMRHAWKVMRFMNRSICRRFGVRDRRRYRLDRRRMAKQSTSTGYLGEERRATDRRTATHDRREDQPTNQQAAAAKRREPVMQGGPADTARASWRKS